MAKMLNIKIILEKRSTMNNKSRTEPSHPNDHISDHPQPHETAFVSKYFQCQTLKNGQNKVRRATISQSKGKRK